MSAGEEWNENLANIDYLINCMGNLEREDVIYLEEYLVGDDSPNSQSPGHWSSLRQERDKQSSSRFRTDEGGGADGVGSILSPRVEEGDTGNKEDLPNPDDPDPVADKERNQGSVGILKAATPVRSTRGVTKPKFVSYQAFPKTKEKPFMCELCGLRLATRESRRRHILAKHIKERTNFCNVCGKAFIFKFALRAHQAVHSATPNFICVCGMSFTVRASYMDHIKRIHRAASEIKYVCELCFKSFGDRHTLRIHLISVHKPKTIPCGFDGCDKVFSTIGLMRSHYRYHLKQRFTCIECGQSFSTESYMYKHRRTHSGIRPYVCVDCGKTYLSVSHLNKHRRAAHSSERPFQCSFCGKCYKSKDQLTFHENSHKGEKPFQCNICGYATAYRHTYYAHKKKHLVASSANGAQNANQQDKSSGDTEAAANSKPHRKDKRVRKTSTSSKAKKKVKNVSNKKSNKAILPQTVNYSVKSLPVPVTQGMNLSASKDLSVSSFGSGSPSLNVICVVPTGLGSSAGDLQQQDLPTPDKTSSNSVVIQSNPEARDVQLLTSCVPSGSAHQTVVLSQEGKLNFSTNNLVQNYRLDSSKMLSDKEVKIGDLNLQSEKPDPYIIVSSNGKCALPSCESSDDSLLLFKVGDNSYIGICSQHTFSDGSHELCKDGDLGKQLTTVDLSIQSLGSISLQTDYDPKNLHENLISAGNTDMPLLGEGASGHLSQQHQQERQNLAALTTVPVKNDGAVVVSDSITPQAAGVATTVNTSHVDTTATLPSSQVESRKTSSGEVCSAEEFSSIMELDPGAASLSGHIVDESFSLAQLEVVCPLCDEQFLCMGDYVTHMECSHS